MYIYIIKVYNYFRVLLLFSCILKICRVYINHKRVDFKKNVLVIQNLLSLHLIHPQLKINSQRKCLCISTSYIKLIYSLTRSPRYYSCSSLLTFTQQHISIYIFIFCKNLQFILVVRKLILVFKYILKISFVRKFYLTF